MNIYFAQIKPRDVYEAFHYYKIGKLSTTGRSDGGTFITKSPTGYFSQPASLGFKLEFVT